MHGAVACEKVPESLRTQNSLALHGVLNSLKLDLAQSATACSVAVSPWKICAFCPSQKNLFCVKVGDTYPTTDGLVAAHQQTVLHSKKEEAIDAVLVITNKNCGNVI